MTIAESSLAPRLAKAGVASQIAQFHASDGIELGEDQAVKALCTVADGAIFRLEPWQFAFLPQAGLDDGELVPRIRLAFESAGIEEPPQTEIRPIEETEDQDPAFSSGRGITLIAELARTSNPEPETEAVIDARFAIRLAELSAEGLSAAIEQARSQSLDVPSEPKELGALPGPDFADVLAELGSLSAKIDLLASTEPSEQPAPEIDVVLEREGLQRLSIALQGILRRLDQQCDALSERVDALSIESEPDLPDEPEIPSALEGMISEIRDNSRAGLERISAEIASIGASAPPEVDIALEREGLQRLSVAFQGILRRLDQQCDALSERVDALTVDHGPDLPDEPEIPSALEGMISEIRDISRAGLERISAEIASIGASAPPEVDIALEREGLQRLSVAFQGILRRLDQQCDILTERLSRLPDEAEGSSHHLELDITPLEEALSERYATLSNSIADIRAALDGQVAAAAPSEDQEEARRIADETRSAVLGLDQQVSALIERQTRFEEAAQDAEAVDAEGLAAILLGKFRNEIETTMSSALEPIKNQLAVVQAAQLEILTNMKTRDRQVASEVTAAQEELRSVADDLLALRKEFRSVLAKQKKEVARLEETSRSPVKANGELVPELRDQVDLALAEMLAHLTKTAANSKPS